jgi:hypothetical protein
MLVLALDELLVQLALAETGTACRTAERVIGRWDQEFRRGNPELDALAGARWVQRMFRQLVDGIAIGERALTDGRRIKDDPTLGLVDNVDENRLTIKTALRKPGDHDLPGDPARVFAVPADGGRGPRAAVRR